MNNMVNTLKTLPTILGIKMPRHFLMLYIVIFSACTSVAQQNIPKGAEILMQVYPDFVKGYNDGYLLKPMPWHELSKAQQPAAAVKVNLRPGLGVDASVKPAANPAAQKPATPAAKPAATAAKPAEGGN